ncbi:MAG: alpha/beta hydrolase [Elusimicrobia bacterium]|nr:alpha/beta hydrolase [Elusimicrobiota bacterium]
MPNTNTISIWTNDSPRLHLLCHEADGLPILLAHGMAGNAHWWDPVAPFLAEGLKPVALDFHGHGDSQWHPEGRYDTELFVENIEEARHALGWTRMILAGHSLGARVALEYARRRPERLLGLIAVDFLPELHPAGARRFERARSRPQPLYSDAEAMLDNFRLQPRGTLLGKEGLRRLAAHSLRKTNEGFTWKFDWKAFLYRYEPIWPALPQIRVPSLVVRGENSAVLSREEFARVARDMPRARAAEIPRAHHHVTLDAPEGLAREMLRFARELGVS